MSTEQKPWEKAAKFKPDRPIACLDCETTGSDPATARIISLAVVHLDPKWPEEPISLSKENIVAKRWLFNPGIPIPEQSSKIHGITDDKVKNCPTFKANAADVLKAVSGCDLLGYNARSFDVPVLWEEFNRAGIAWKLSGVRMIDAFEIFRRKEPRDLAAAVKFYVGGDHTDAHDALADVLATIAVFFGQRNAYADIAQMDAAKLSAFCTEEELDGRPAKRLDLSGHIMQTLDDGVARYTAKRVRGKAVTDDRGFGEWMIRNDFPEHTKMTVRRLLGEL